jgi:hypothetical protein
MLTYKNFKSENVTTDSKNLAKGPDFEDCRWDPREGGRESAKSHISRCWAPNVLQKFTPQEWERKERRDVRKSEGRISKNEGRDTPSLFAEDNG